MIIWIVVGLLISLVILLFSFALFFVKGKIDDARSLLKKAELRRVEMNKKLDNEKREAVLKLKDELYRRKSDFELEMKRERVELERFQSKLNNRFENIEKKEQGLEELQREMQQKEKSLSHLSDQLRLSEQKIKYLYEDLVARLENVSNMSKEEAKQSLLEILERDVRHANEKLLGKIEEDYKSIAKEKAINILISAMQRNVVDQVALHSSSVVHLPNEEMKGRIIGKEGRNIKALEMATGVEFVIGDTPEIITISSFNPVRREIAKRSLERLIFDGRINPTRIEETVDECEKAVDEIVEECGRNAVGRFNIQGIKPEIINYLGQLHFRTSFSQNVLTHSIEVAILSRMIAEELGVELPDIALRAGLLHDIGKAVSAEQEGTHAIVGADIAKRYGEDPLVVNAIAAHHEEVPFDSIYSIIVMIADTVSASRPGARRETLAAYLKRLSKLEEIAHDFIGVKKAYALQAGREIRVIVEEDLVDDDKALSLARELAERISKEMMFPGQIKVNVIRERRAIEYAR